MSDSSKGSFPPFRIDGKEFPGLCRYELSTHYVVEPSDKNKLMMWSMFWFDTEQQRNDVVAHLEQRMREDGVANGNGPYNGMLRAMWDEIARIEAKMDEILALLKPSSRGREFI